MRRRLLKAGLTLSALTLATVGYAAVSPLDRLPPDVLDIAPPTLRVAGDPGSMSVQIRDCVSMPTEETRRRVVNAAIQEWGYFGFSVVDQTTVRSIYPGAPRAIVRPSRPGYRDNVRTADDIGGYWAATGDGAWIIDRQNRRWKGPSGAGTRWQDPWSAAFISWVMCEAGLGDSSQFKRHIAHHAYIDQAIVARDRADRAAAYEAYDVGEQQILPGDMICTAREERYTTLNERRRQLGVGVRSHCDIVVQIDLQQQRLLVIGGNVRGSVRLKLWPTEVGKSGHLQPMDQSMISGGRAVFAHLKLRAEPIEIDALDNSPTILALNERDEAGYWLERAIVGPDTTIRDYGRLWPINVSFSDLLRSINTLP
ncbi:MAG TPA: DUF2272 domain-containing protein [Gammaproteobacteria bacterium]